jgi:hypothetical protein
MQNGTVFMRSHTRLGRLQLTWHGFFRMNQFHLTTDILEETFRYGKEVEAQKIVRQFDDYSVGLIYALDETRVFRGDLANQKFVIITCWKEVKKHG